MNPGIIGITLPVVFLDVDIEARGELIGTAHQFSRIGVLPTATKKEPVELNHSVIGHKPDMGTDGQKGHEVAPQVVVAHPDLVVLAELLAVDPADLLLFQFFTGIGAEISRLRLASVHIHVGLRDTA